RRRCRRGQYGIRAAEGRGRRIRDARAQGAPPRLCDDRRAVRARDRQRAAAMARRARRGVRAPDRGGSEAGRIPARRSAHRRRLLTSIAGKFTPWVAEHAALLGAHAGVPATQELARLANRHVPELKTHDRFGNRTDWVEFHPAWHALMALAFGHQVHSLAWTA